MILKVFQPVTNHLLGDWLECVFWYPTVFDLYDPCVVSRDWDFSQCIQGAAASGSRETSTIRDSNKIVLNPCRIASCTFKLSVIKLLLIRWVALIWKFAPQFYPTKFTPSVYSLSSCVFRVLWSRLTSVSEHTQRPLLKINCSVVLSLENVSHNFNLFLHFSGICAIIIEQFTLQLA